MKLRKKETELKALIETMQTTGKAIIINAFL